MEVECSPDADTPRPIGVGLLLCMLERGGEPVAKVGVCVTRMSTAAATAAATLALVCDPVVLGQPVHTGHTVMGE